MPMGRRQKFRIADIEEALRLCAGIRGAAALKLGTTTTTVTNYINRSKRLQDVVAELEEQHLDMAESKLLAGIKNGDRTYVIFYLKTKGKRRGYTERVDVSGPEGLPIALDIDLSQASDEELLAIIRGSPGANKGNSRKG
ncbi:hypothetical protein EKK58_05580 [Candidatus Dependentiae bacterium]|nr:MAG: hypothetical protein EKK58_05580 [Candidatus Dependentiae bacterium]